MTNHWIGVLRSAESDITVTGATREEVEAKTGARRGTLWLTGYDENGAPFGWYMLPWPPAKDWPNNTGLGPNEPRRLP